MNEKKGLWHRWSNKQRCVFIALLLPMLTLHYIVRIGIGIADVVEILEDVLGYKFVSGTLMNLGERLERIEESANDRISKKFFV